MIGTCSSVKPGHIALYILGEKSCHSRKYRHFEWADSDRSGTAPCETAIQGQG